MHKRNYRKLKVNATQRLTENMQRITLQGDDLADFPDDIASGYIKLLLTDTGAAMTTTQVDEPGASRAVMRTYSIRHYHPDAGTITVDFVLHRTNPGPASSWAQQAKPGDTLFIKGPGTVKPLNHQADWFFLVGDMTGLPALSCQLEQLPNDARGYAFIEIMSAADRQPIHVPHGISLNWVVSSPAERSAKLIESVTHAPWREGTPSIWCASEFNTMRTLRRYFKNERRVSREHIYISSYWKSGHTEEEHKVVKRLDSQTEAA